MTRISNSTRPGGGRGWVYRFGRACLLVLFVWVIATPLQAASKRVVRLCVDPDWYPFEALAPDGKHIGIAHDLLQQIASQADLRFDVLPTPDWQSSLQLAKAGQCDALSLLNQTPERQQWLTFTTPYLTDANVFITRDEHPYISSPTELNGQILALPAGTSIEERLRRDYPQIRILPVADEEEALQAVEQRQAQATLRSRIMAAYIINSRGWFNLKIAGEIPAYANGLRMGLVQHDAELLARLNLAIASLSQDDLNQTMNRHIPLVVKDIDYTLALITIGSLVIVILVFSYWSRKMRGINAQLQASQTHIAVQLDQLSTIERELRLSRERYKLLVEQLQESIVVVRGRHILFSNPAFTALTGFEPEALMQLDISTLFFADERDELWRRAKAQLSGLTAEQRHLFRLCNRQGQPVWVEARLREIDWEGEKAILNTLSDVTKRVEYEAEMKHLATHDPLTGLPNRELLKRRLHRSIEFARDTHQKLALLFVDLDKFKPVNDSYGHDAGDMVLKRIAQRLREALRESDLVARWGGDEFIVVLENVNASATVERIARKLVAVISEPIALAADLPVQLSCSIGIVVYPDHGEQIDDLINKSDQMMYKAKKQGAGSIIFFAPVIPQSGNSFFRLLWSRDLECGLAQIDEEHEALFALANQLLATIVAGRFTEQTEPCLLGLLSHAKSHFKHEISTLMKMRYPDAVRHDLIHKQLLHKAGELQARYLRGELEPLVLIHFIVYEIVDQHMMVEDKKWFGFVYPHTGNQRD
ncbi:diguanylate cyclase domain-containing protein [Pseudaeromonas sharmana]|uniref:Diguanylate cyclase domain-containing protein n=1 Tax=Pseudaeromonas sharmana TaxID=328412 RepID=A0ABV8CR74_9GAMM